ncbi:MAG: phytanoyl-CoA dioxygenase family protein [Dokdonia sp.]|jgi:hypothetical protein
MNPIFKNPDVQKQFEMDGYVKIPLLDIDEVIQLFEYYNKQNLNNKIEGGFHISLDNQNQALVHTIAQTIETTLEPKISNVFKDYKIFTASYVVKEPGKKNIVPPHQDWSFVDESKAFSATCWIPLVDVTEDNGALGVIKGSHKIFSHPRSSPSPQSKSPLADHIFTLFPYVDIVEMQAGECLIFDNRLIHASPPNLSQNTRVAVGVGVTGHEVQLKHYYQIPEAEEEMLEVYDVDPSFFTFYNNKRLSDLFDAQASPSDLTLVEKIVRDTPSLSTEEMHQLISNLEGVSYNTPLMQKLAKLFNYTMDDTSQKDTMTQENKAPEIQEETSYSDTRSFFQKYTPINIIKEIAWRAKGRP